MNADNARRFFWIRQACCAGPLLVFVAYTYGSAILAFALAYRAWLLAAGGLLVSVDVLIRQRRVRRDLG